jgi:hypothetical protein
MTCQRSQQVRRRYRRGRVALGAGGVLLFGIALAEAAGLRINATASMPRGNLAG